MASGEVSQILQLSQLSWTQIISISVIAAFSSFIGAYMAERGKVIATEQGIENITKKVEVIKNQLQERRLFSSAYAAKQIETYMSINTIASEYVLELDEAVKNFRHGASICIIGDVSEEHADALDAQIVNHALFMSEDIENLVSNVETMARNIKLGTNPPNAGLVDVLVPALYENVKLLKGKIKAELQAA